MNVKNIIRSVWFTPGPKNRWGLPCIFEGQPGVGKTQIIEGQAARYGMHCEVLIGSIREPTDVGGLARLDEDRFRLVPAAWAAQLLDENKKHAVLFLDELNTNVPAMQAAMLRLATDGAVGEMILPDTVRIMAAQNKTEEAAGGWDLAPPLANRFLHFQWGTPSVADWGSWLLGGGTTEEDVPERAVDIEAKVLESFDGPFARTKGLVAGFLKKKPSLLHKMPSSASAEASRAWPSPRTWEMLVRALAGAEVHNLSETDTEELASACVGVGAANELLVYRKENDLPDPADVLDGNVKWKHDPRRLDITASLLSACAAIIAPDKAPNRKERAEALWKMIAEISKDASDVCVQAACVLAQKGFITGKEATKALSTIQPILAAAGYLHKR